MDKNKGKNEKKEIVFSKEIDSIIDGLALGITVVLLAILVYYKNVFHNVLADRIISVILIAIGVAGTSFELQKISTNKVQGISDFVIGAILALPALSVIVFVDNILLNVIMIVLLALFTFGILKGVISIIYSIKQASKTSGNKKMEFFKIITVITEIIAFFVAVMQLYTELSKTL